jgi:hypothetical protein
MRAIRDEDFGTTPRGEDIPQEGQIIVLDTDLEFDENVDPEEGQDFVAKVALRDGEYVLLSVNGVPVINESEETYLEDEEDLDLMDDEYEDEEEDEDEYEYKDEKVKGKTKNKPKL